MPEFSYLQNSNDVKVENEVNFIGYYMIGVARLPEHHQCQGNVHLSLTDFKAPKIIFLLVKS